jgi:hypothetical protein
MTLSYIHRRVFLFLVALLGLFIFSKYWLLFISSEIIICIFIIFMYIFIIAI